MEKFASTISKIGTSPVWVLAWTFLMGLIFQTKFGIPTKDFIGILFLGVWTFVVGMILKTRLDLDNKNRKYRSYLIISIISGWAVICLFYWKDFSWFMQDALKIAIFTTIVLLVNNIFYRISFHVALSTSLLILVNHFSAWAFWPLFLIIPLIGWSRLYLKKHTLLQVIAGFLVPFLVYFLTMYFNLLQFVLI